MNRSCAALLLLLGLAACGEEVALQLPSPQEPGSASVGYFCGMAVAEHRGPKGQVFLAGQAAPLWFTSVRDALAFTMLPGEPRTVVALYVSDMSGSADTLDPLPGAWVLAREAVFVAGSRATGGMGAQEIVPFAERTVAERFRRAHGGAVYRFDEIPERLVLGADGGLAEAPSAPTAKEGSDHGAHAAD